MDNLLLTFFRLLLLNLLHTLYTSYITFQSVAHRVFHRPRPLQAARTKLPRHLSLLLLPHEKGPICTLTHVQAVQIAAEYCLEAGVEGLSVFVEDRDLLAKLEAQCGSLAPPSDLYIQFLGSQHAKALLARTAQLLADTYSEKQATPFSISVEQLGVLIDCTFYPPQSYMSPCQHRRPANSPTPDVLLVYDLDIQRRHRPLSLSGYPPWQICVTEIYQHQRRLPWGKTLRRDLEDSIRCCLDEYEKAEMRFGR